MPDPGRVVYFSSSAAYPVGYQNGDRRWKLAETDIGPDNPDAMYGWVKLTGERLMTEVRNAGIPTHIFRPFSGYGVDQSQDYPFPSFMQRASANEQPFQIWGDGNQVRDWVHVDDIVNCVLAAIEQDYQEPLNIGTGIGTSMNELATMCLNAAGHGATLEHLLDKPVGVQYRVADVSNMRKVYEPEISLEEGIARCFR